MSSSIVQIAICVCIICAGFFLVGISVGAVCRRHGDDKAAGSALFLRGCLVTLLYFGAGLVIGRKVMHKTILDAMVCSLTFRDIPAFAGWLLCCALLYAAAIVAIAWLQSEKGSRMFTQLALFRRIRRRPLVSAFLISCGCFLLLTACTKTLPIDMVWGGSEFFAGGILAFLFFFVGGILAAKKLPFLCRPSSFRERIAEVCRIPFRMFRKHPYVCYGIIYTIGFAVVFVGVCSYNIIKDVGFIWQTDAMPQYLPYMRYTGEYLKELISNLLQGDFTLKMYDFTIGMGDDIRAVVRTRPLEYLCILFSADKTEDLYNVLVVFRLYLAGLTFSAYCKFRSLPWLNILIASFVYMFGDYIFFLGFHHPVFITPMILLPLLLIGMDRLICREGCLFFTCMVGISLFINYYFLYMSTIGLGVYAIVRFLQIYKQNRIREFLCMMRRIIGYYLLGCGMACATFLPTVIRTLNSERVGHSQIAYDSLFNYGENAIMRLFLASVTTGYSGKGNLHLGFAVIVLPALVVFFVRPIREYLGLKIIMLLEIIGMLLPVCGLVMSAFSSVTNRWVYLAVFTVAYITACVADDFLRMTWPQMAGLCLVTAAYGVCAYVGEPLREEVKISLYSLISLTAVLLIIQTIKTFSHYQLAALLSVCVLISLTLHGRYLYDPAGDNYISEFMEVSKMQEYYQKEEFLHFTKINDDSFYRCDAITTRDYYENISLSLGYNGTSMYNSVINGSLVNYHNELASAGISAIHRIYSMDGRTAMEALASVKYFLAPAGEDGSVPYGFTKSAEYSYGEFDVYENEYPLSIGYTYTQTLSRSVYETLSPLEKQQIMLKAVVLEDEQAELLPQTTDTDAGILEGKAQITEVDPSVVLTDSSCIIAEPETGFCLSYEKKAGYEAYLSIENFSTETARAKIVVSTDNFSKNLIIRNINQDHALGRDDYLINLGYSNTEETEQVNLCFTIADSYGIGKVKILYVPMSDYEADVSARNEESLQDVTVETNTVSGSISVSENKMMVLSIPYSQGWTAYVDGTETTLLKANTAYMALYLESGEHEIRLVYRTPGLAVGAAISIGSILLTLGIWIFCKKKAGGKSNPAPAVPASDHPQISVL